MNGHAKVAAPRYWNSPPPDGGGQFAPTWSPAHRVHVWPSGTRRWPQEVEGRPYMLQWHPTIRGKRVAVIGNGPSAMENPEDPDRFDLVVRFNKAKTGPGFEAVGSRTDIWCSAVGPHSGEWFQNCGAQMILDSTCRSNRPPWSRNHEAYVRTVEQQLGIRVTDAGLTVDRVRDELSGTMPTSGLIAIAWLLAQSPAQIFMTGFSFEPGSQHYDPADNSFNHTYHDTLAELGWLAQHAHKPVFRFDETIQRRLATVRDTRVLVVEEGAGI